MNVTDYDNGVTIPDPHPPRPPRRWPYLAAGLVFAVAGSIAAATVLSASAPAPTHACQQAVTRQNQFVTSALTNGYPDGMSIAGAMAVQVTDLKIINAALKVCPPNTKIRVLP